MSPEEIELAARVHIIDYAVMDLLHPINIEAVKERIATDPLPCLAEISGLIDPLEGDLTRLIEEYPGNLEPFEAKGLEVVGRIVSVIFQYCEMTGANKSPTIQEQLSKLELLVAQLRIVILAGGANA